MLSRSCFLRGLSTIKHAHYSRVGSTFAAQPLPARSLSTPSASATSDELPSEADVVIIGGGSLGTSTLYHLAKKGVNAVLLEKDQLSAGTTWHSAGLVWRLRPSDVDVELLAYSRTVAKTLEEETGVSTGWVENGGLFIASTEERLKEYKRLQTLGRYYGVESHVLSPEETKKLYPLMNVDDVVGTLYSPGDGTVDPSGITASLARGARMAGGKVFENVAVTGIETEGCVSPGIHDRRRHNRARGRVTGVRTATGVIKTSRVVNCAGAWAPMVGAMAGVQVPLCAMRHAYVVTEGIEGIAGMPNVRDHDLSVYLKVQGDTIHWGGYEGNPEFWDPVPEFAFSLFDLDWDVFSAHIEGGVNRVPILEQTGIRSTVCGPESFTPDHKPLMGEVPELQGFFLGCGFNSAGMMFGPSSGRELATWVTEGRPSLDMFSVDIDRFHPSVTANARWIKETSHESYAKNYSVVFPHDEPMAGRNLRTDPIHPRLVSAGCVFQLRHGYERPGWFVTPRSDDTHSIDPTVLPYDWYGNYEAEHGRAHEKYGYLKAIEGDNTFGWAASHSLVRDEVMAVRNGVAVFNMSYFGKYFMSGDDAMAALSWICCADVAREVGATVYTNMLNDRGGAECDLTVSRLAPGPDGKDRFYIAAGGGSASHDFQWIRGGAEEAQRQGLCGGDWDLVDESDMHGLLSVQGPNSMELLNRISDGAFDKDEFAFSTNRVVKVAGHDVLAIRLTFVGELGWELHMPSGACVDVYDALMAAGGDLGVTNAGYRAIDSCSIEKGYKHWHEDLRSDDTPLEASMAFVCKLKSDIPFRGRPALEAQKAEGLRRKLMCFTLPSHHQVPLHGNELILARQNEGDEAQPVGYVRRADYGHSIGKSIAYGYVKGLDGGKVTNKKLKEVAGWELEAAGVRYPLELHVKAVFDPTNERVKGLVAPNSLEPPSFGNFQHSTPVLRD